MPVFVDIRKDTLNIDETLIEQAITSRTKAIIPVHYAGVPCAMDELMDIAEHHGLFVVEDAAQALLSTYKFNNSTTYELNWKEEKMEVTPVLSKRKAVNMPLYA